MSFELSMSDLNYDVTILPVNSLKLHEAVIDDHVDELLAAIQREDVIRDPVIVDRETNVVLDGMHRVTAIRRLGLSGIPVCRVDYRTPEIEVGGWIWVFETSKIEYLKPTFHSRELRFNPVESTRREWPSLPLLLGSDTAVELDLEDGTPKQVLDRTMAAVDDLSAAGIQSQLQPNSTLGRSGTEVTLVLPAPDKSAVIAAAESGDRFPPNTTRHIIPARPMALNVSLELLASDAENGVQRLNRQLRKRSIDRLPPGSEYAGRTYEEALLLFG